MIYGPFIVLGYIGRLSRPNKLAHVRHQAQHHHYAINGTSIRQRQNSNYAHHPEQTPSTISEVAILFYFVA
jgi:hypothetical protein